MRTIARIAALILVLLTCMPLPAQLWAAPATLPLAQADAGEIEARIAELYSRPPTIADHFRQDDGRWTVESSGDLAHSYQTSTYHLKVLQPQTIGWSLADASATNFYLEVDAFHTAGPIDNEYGVIFRYTDADNFYLFGASSDGYYIIQKVVDGEWSDLAEWTTSEAIHTGQQSGNTMGIFADGAQITALLNGEVVATLEDDSFSSGQIGLVAGTFDEANAEIAFDDLMLWDLDETPSTDLTPTPTPEVTTEPTAEVTATPESTDVAAQIAEIKIGDPLVSEDFRRDEGVWPTTSDENVAYSIKGRAYHILVKTANWLGFSFNTTIENQQLPDFLAEVAVTHASGPLDAEYGLLFHYQDSDNFYLYAVNGMGSYSLWKKVDGEWLSLIDWTETDALNPDEAATNHLALLVQAAQITLLINDTVIAQATDEASFSGTVGLVAGAFDKPEVEVAFDNFDLWALAGGTELPTPEITPTDEETATATPTATSSASPTAKVLD
nr:hypothetical protein [Caldilineaceae bacterium]